MTKVLRSRLLLLRFPPEFAGGGMQASRLMERLSARDVEMIALTAMPVGLATPPDEQAFGGRVIRFRLPGPERLRDLLLGARAALWLLLHPGWDVLHVSSFSFFGVLPMIVARTLGRPVIVKTTQLGEHGEAFGTSGGRIGAWVLGVHRRASAFVALSGALERSLREDARIRGEVHRIPNGVDTAFFRPAEPDERERERQRLGFDPEACVVVSCGMVDPRKGMLELVRAAAATSVRPLVVAIAGPPGPDARYLAEIRSLAEACEGMELHWMGQLAPADVAALMRAADIFVLASRAEGLPNALLEAMSTGLACIATDIPGSADVLHDGGGRLVPLDDPAALARAIESLARDAAARARLGSAALEKIRTRYSMDSVADRYRALYEKLID